MVIRAIALAALVGGAAPSAVASSALASPPFASPAVASAPAGGPPRSLLHADVNGAAARADRVVPAAVNTYVVNSTGNGDDSSTADGTCNDGTGHCTLRAAITQANASGGSDEIDFAIGTGAQTIQVPGGVALPALTDTITIDATTQPGYSSAGGHPVITLDGLGQGALTNGLALAGSTDAVIGVDVIRFSAAGILATGDGALIEGCYAGVDHTGTVARGNAIGVRLYGSNETVATTATGAPNVLSGNTQVGVVEGGADASHGDLVAGAVIGLSADGTAALGQHDGVLLQGTGNTLGSPTELTVVSGNTTGVDVPWHNAVVQDVLVGTDSTGTVAHGNGTGVIFQTAPTAGTLTGSLISGNGTGVSAPPGTTVSGNYVGTDLSGTMAIPNSTGISSAGAGTVISGNLVSGNTVGISDGDGGDTIQLNYIGTDIGVSGAVPNQTGAVLNGAEVNHFSANVVAGNSGDGIQLDGDSHSVTNNYIGTVPGGPALGNGGNGVLVRGDGGDEITGNVIDGNGSAGIDVTAGLDTSITANDVYDNGGLGIDLGGDGVTPNDASDADTGPNGLQNFPVLTSAHVSFKTTNVNGTLNSAASTTYRLDFYDSPSCDSSGNGEATTWLGTTTASTDSIGNLSFSYPSHTLAPPHTVITATATDPDGSTSELSTCRTVAGASADIGVSMTQDQSVVTAGNPETYHVKITNFGPATSSDVAVTDTLSTAATVLSVTPTQGSCSVPTTLRITCALGQMAGDSSAGVEIVIKYTQTGWVRNTARLNSKTYDPKLADDTATIRTHVI